MVLRGFAVLGGEGCGYLLVQAGIQVVGTGLRSAVEELAKSNIKQMETQSSD